MRKHIACNRDKVPGMQSGIAIFMGEIPFRSFNCGDVSLLVQTVRFCEVFCNIGNPHAVGQKPITFYRQVDWVRKVVKGHSQGLMKAVQRCEVISAVLRYLKMF